MNREAKKLDALLRTGASATPGTELAELLRLASSIAALPKQSVPAPSMRRRFMSVATVPARWWQVSLHLAWGSATAMVLLLASAGTAYGAYVAVPGQSLYQVKKTVERVQLSFAQDPIAKANLQVRFTERRLADTRKAIAKENPVLKAAAIKELSEQTKVAVKDVTEAATPELKEEATPIITALVALTNEQEALTIESENRGTAAILADGKISDAAAAKLELAAVTASLDATTSTSSVTSVATGTSTPTTTPISIKNTTDGTTTASSTGGLVKGTSTTQAATAPPLEPEPLKETKPEVLGQFIWEDPAPQYVP